MSPEAHDRALAFTSHLPHLAAAALSIALPEKYYEVVASGFRDTTRIAASDPDLWTAVFLENKGQLLDALGRYEAVLHEFQVALEKGDKQQLLKLWNESKRRRLSVSDKERPGLPR
jgi:prephenate dehydrogenase